MRPFAGTLGALFASFAVLAAPATAARAAAPCGSVVLPAGLGASPLPGTAATFHPILMDGSLYEQQPSSMMYLPLLWYSGTNRIDWSRSVASAVSVNAADTVFTVTLKPWVWSDGVPITSADVLYTWDMIRALGSAYSEYGIGGVPRNIASVTAPDDHTFVVTTETRVNPDWFKALGLGQFSPIPKHAWSRYSIAQQQTMQSTASFYDPVDGPWRITSLVLGQHAVFVPNMRYEGHRPSIARLVVDFLQGTNPLQALQAHQVDAANIPAPLLGAIGRLPGFKKIQFGPTDSFNVLIPDIANAKKPFLADVRFRQAVARAINQRAIIATVFHGRGAPRHGLTSPGDTIFTPPEMRGGHSPMLFDPAAANALLDAMGYRPGPDGIRERDGVRLDVTELESAGNDDGLMIDQVIASDLRRVGIAFHIKQLEFNQLYATMLSPANDWDFVGLAYSGGAYPDGTQMFLSTSGQNLSHYKNAEMDRLVEAASDDPGIEAVWAMERYIVEQQPMIFMGGLWPTLLVRPGLDGVRLMAPANATWLPELLTLSGPMACDAPHG